MRLSQLDAGVGVVDAGVGAGDVADGDWLEAAAVAAGSVGVWLGDGRADVAGLAVREGLGDRDGVREGDCVTAGAEVVGAGPGFTPGPG